MAAGTRLERAAVPDGASHSCPAVALAAILACDYAERIFPLQFEPRDQFEQRQKKLQQVQALGLKAYPHEFRWSDTVADLATQFGATPGADLEANRREVRIAGRIVSLRLMGKAGFAHLQGAGKRIQIYVKKTLWASAGSSFFSCSTSATGSACVGTFSAPRRMSFPSGWRRYSSCPRRCSHCRRNGKA